ncbi:nicotinate (nicotinamide) nucleotide adenylyltransferase [Hyphomonas sp. FCG-A18]|uniref:nicotinate (nicotinamide) nucleotide adenylyltransferase n=1 Tax=Hyphomonas sp. FCG-A18 TaxID=3080019 RepID=UPI002B2C28D6|nr:nicotinate (nicotinamide) nucleotide adenylyltransferase [Hyphomonas sp. FCG-A18]
MSRLRVAQHLPPASTRARIGLFGGSFNPPHDGHMHVAETALKRLALDQVWWIPARGNPLKEAPAAFQGRLGAVQIMTRNHRGMRVSDIEAHAHLTYTIDTVRLFRAHSPGAQFVWIMGSDSLMNFHHWKDWHTLARTIPIAVIARPGATLAARSSHFAKVFKEARRPRRMSAMLAEQKSPAWIYLTAPLNPASSTAIRQGRSR